MQKIMFNDKFGLTKAVLEERKTQTRRIIPKDFFSLTWDEKNGTLWYENSMGDFIDVRNSKYALYKVGEVVAVAQSYRDCGGISEFGKSRWEIIAASVGAANGGWNNKMFVRASFMPHQIRITDMKIERIQDISDEDCLKEGIIKWDAGQKDIPFFSYPNSAKCDYDTPQEAFANLINKVSKKDVWNENPYVFVYEFELVK